MEGWNGGRGSSWSYLQQTASIVSSSSGTGTIVSTAYTSNVSCPSTSSTEAAIHMHFLSLGIHEDVNDNNLEVCEESEDEEAEEEHIRSLVQGFFSAPSANCRIRVGDISIVERWLKELGVGWVLSLDGGASAAAGEEEIVDRDARSWIWALGHIAQTFCFMTPPFPDRDSAGVPDNCQRKGEDVGERCVPDQYHLLLFIQETMSKILNFVYFLVSRDNNLITLLRAHGALSKASRLIRNELWEFKSETRETSPTTAVEVQRIENEMAILLSAHENKLCEAIRSTMEKIRTELMTEDGDDPSSPQGSSDVHRFTRSVMSYIRFLWSNYWSVFAAICDPNVPPVENERSLIGMMIEMVSCLQEKLASISESFPDQGLRFLFLLNNSYSIKEQLSYRQASMIPDVDRKIEAYMERYLQVSWAPLLSCLFNPTPLCLGINYSPLSKFESEFQKIYSTQKQWKVPDPVLRRMLRSVITDKIISSYTEYIEDNKVTNPKFSPRELNAMLQELFEGR